MATEEDGFMISAILNALILLNIDVYEILGIPRNSYSSIFIRIRTFRIEEIINPSFSVAIDSTGFKI